jgi:hypothetical protein
MIVHIPLPEGLAGTAWEPSKPELNFLAPPPTRYCLSLPPPLSSSTSSSFQTFINVLNCRCLDVNHAPRMAEGSNMSTVALRVVGDDEKVTQCLVV